DYRPGVPFVILNGAKDLCISGTVFSRRRARVSPAFDWESHIPAKTGLPAQSAKTTLSGDPGLNAAPSTFGKSGTTISTFAIIRNLRRNCSYIHRNPVRRGLCEHAEDWSGTVFVTTQPAVRDA